MNEILEKAEQDRAIRCALLMLKDIVRMASVLDGVCHISAEYFAKKYNYNPRTFFRHKERLVQHGYIREKGRWQVELVKLIDNKNKDRNVANCDINGVQNRAKKCDKNVKNRDTFVKNRDTNVTQIQISKKANKREGQQRVKNDTSSFVALPPNSTHFLTSVSRRVSLTNCVVNTQKPCCSRSYLG